jgi:hypothetical protein
VGTKIANTDTAAMLAPYKKMVNEIIASNITSLTADAINGALNSKVNLVDSNTVYVTPRQLAASAFNPTAINNSIALKANTASPIFTGTLTAGDVTYPNTHGTNGQVLTTTGTGALTWATPTSSANVSLLTGVVAVANGGTGQTTVPGILSTLGFSGNNVIIGKLAGTPGIGENANNVAIGGGAGKTAQGQSSISIGYVAGYANQGVNSLAIGGNAAQSNQGTQAVALGYAAGQNSQGVNSVALGAFAGNSQVANSIAINASGSALNPTNAGFYVNPVRATSATSSLLYYNTSTKEITSGAISGVDLTTAQTVGGLKTFSDQVVVPNIAFNNGNAIWQIGGDASATNFKLYQGGCCSRLEMDNLGRLAIGANYSPAYQLDVQGDARFTQNINVNGVIIGKGAGNNEESVAIGGGAMGASNVNGKRNTAVGAGAMASYNGTSWDNNTSVGYNNLSGMTSGSGNTSVGAESMMANVTGTQNTSVGNQSLINTTGNDNIGIGKRSGQTITTGSQNTIVGTDADVAVNNLNNATAIGYGANVTASNTIQLGNADITNVKTSGTITAGDVTYPSNHGSTGQVLSTTGSGTLTWTTPSTGSGGTHTIGESYGGGKVFYVYDNGKHGLIAATSDQSTAMRWYGGSNTNTRARGDGVGAGLKNTAIIIANQGAVDGSEFAATVCNEYKVEVDGVTYGDWYLPSKIELNLLYLQKSVVGVFANGYYWSSSELDSTSAWAQNFDSGSQDFGNKDFPNAVRAIRAF